VEALLREAEQPKGGRVRDDIVVGLCLGIEVGTIQRPQTRLHAHEVGALFVDRLGREVVEQRVEVRAFPRVRIRPVVKSGLRRSSGSEREGGVDEFARERGESCERSVARLREQGTRRRDQNRCCERKGNSDFHHGARMMM